MPDARGNCDGVLQDDYLASSAITLPNRATYRSGIGVAVLNRMLAAGRPKSARSELKADIRAK